MHQQNDFAILRSKQIDEARSVSDELAARLDWPRERVLEVQLKGLRQITSYAKEHSPYYRKSLKNIDTTTLDLNGLQRLPVVTKDELMLHWNDVVTDSDLRLEEVNAHLEEVHSGEEPNPYYMNRYYVSATGGTSGNRGVFVWDWENGVIAPNLTYRMKKRFETAHMTDTDRSKRSAIICADSLSHASHFLFPVMLDAERKHRVFPASWPIDRIVEALNEYQPDQLIGYASIVQELCALAIKGKLHIAPMYISTNSEPLFPEARQLAIEAWGINIHNSWGSVDMGSVVATEGESFNGMTLAEDFYIFEHVDDQYRIADDPALATRVLVTRLFNKTMPLIRYEMTDTLLIDKGSNTDAPGYRRIADVKGRSDDWFVYGDVKIHPMVFRSVLGQQHSISEYQVRQTSKGALILLVTLGQIDESTIIHLLQENLETQGLSKPEVSLEIVDELQRHAETNKLKRFIPIET